MYPVFTFVNYQFVVDVVMSQLCYRNREALCPHG